MRFFVALAALAPLLALRGASLGSSLDGSSMCPCIGEDDRWECVKEKLDSYRSCPDDLGIGCKTHDISADCAVSLYQSDVGKQLQCGPSHSGESPWCNTLWCYVNESNCNVDWDVGVLGPYSYATCGNLRQGSDKYFQKTLAAFLQDDPLRVFHPENTLEGGYLGNDECRKVYKYSENRHCKGRIADFWERSLGQLNLSKIDHTVIERAEEDIGHYFRDPNIINQFEDYKDRVWKDYPDIVWKDWPTTKYDLCAFATGMGYVDLCSGAFSLTHRRQAMTFMIELYTAPVFMVSKSRCDFFASEDWRSWKFWFWWVDVFSLGAWGFFVGVVFFFIVAMKGLDKCLDCLDNLDRQSGEEPEEPGEPEEPPQPQQQQQPQDKWERFCTCLSCFTHGLADAILGVCEAFVNKSKTSHRRDSNKPSRARPSHMLRLGLGFFILLSTAVYGSGITAEMVSAKEVKGEVPNLAEARGLNIPLCTHVVFEEPLRPFKVANLTTFSAEWEEVLDNLKNKTCRAALLDDEAWNTFRNRPELCGYHKEPTAELYVPTGAVVSKRAYRTLETFRFAASKAAFFFDKSGVLADNCPSNSTDNLCANIEKEGVPWYTLFSLSVVAATCGVCSLIGIAVQYFGGEDEENKEQKEKMKDEKTNMSKIESLLAGFGEMSKALEDDRKKNMKDEEMNRANMAKIESLLVDLEFGKISQVLKQSNLRPQADAAGPNAVQDDVESSARSTGSGSSSTTPNKPTNICPW